MCSGITRDRFLNGDRYAQRFQKSIYLHLFTDCLIRISPQFSKQTQLTFCICIPHWFTRIILSDLNSVFQETPSLELGHVQMLQFRLETLLYGDDDFDYESNVVIILAVHEFIKDSKRL